ncbi:shikimate dehydrogenase [Leptobacterium sp. I13]|uniref:shikimate dehydrogenase family protein n=1 Tax=Leptobacterium meishanense TaxID=3128904 RepID=UPI0030EB9831
MEEELKKNSHLFGLIGKNISYSFSKKYFNKKFEALSLEEYQYTNFDIPSIKYFTAIIQEYQNLKGLNVTIPYKEQIFPFLDVIEQEAFEIGAVNTIKIENGKLKGYNTDFYGFLASIQPHIQPHHKKALILGTGGASKAIVHAFKKLNIECSLVSRTPRKGWFDYNDLNSAILKEHTIVVNCTPLGTHPKTAEKPAIPYNYITASHLLYDLIYNPTKTAFLKQGEERGAIICNGLKMLELQAEKAWELWNS